MPAQTGCFSSTLESNTQIEKMGIDFDMARKLLKSDRNYSFFASPVMADKNHKISQNCLSDYKFEYLTGVFLKRHHRS